MDKSWMSTPRSSNEYAFGVSTFLDYAAENAGTDNVVLCPCKHCSNRFWLANSVVSEHLICAGFMQGYTTWVLHGEKHVQPDYEPYPESKQDPESEPDAFNEPEE
jgi:hypothetical protein